MNKNKMIKVISCATLLAAGGFAVSGITGCTEKNGEITVKDPKVTNLYNSLKTIANREYKKANNINDEKDYIVGLVSAYCDVNPAMNRSAEFAFVMRTESAAISIGMTLGDAYKEEDALTQIDSYANDVNYSSARVETGNIYKTDEIKNYVLDKYTNRAQQSVGSERYYIDINKPYTYTVFQINDNTVSFAMTGTSGAGIMLTAQDWLIDLNQMDTQRTGKSMEVKEENIPVIYKMLSAYAKD